MDNIHLLEEVLAAGGEGIFVATYKITAAQKAPDVSVDPPSVGALDVLRKIFFEG